MEWIKSLNEAIEYIESNITENIRCEDVAEHIYLSSFHFQRIFSLVTGISVGEYIRNRRLSLAGQELLTGNDKVINIAFKYSYDTPESFSKAFRRFHGVTPNEAKKPGTILKFFNRLIIKITLEGGSSMNYKIEKKEAFRVVAKTKYFKGENSQVGIPKFWDEYYKKGLDEKVTGMLGICAHEKEEKGKWKYGIGCDIKFVDEIPEEFEIIQVPAYTWAIFTCLGAIPDAIQNQWKRVYEEWLPIANYELIPDYDIEFYTIGDCSKDDYLSEIWIPVIEKQ